VPHRNTVPELNDLARVTGCKKPDGDQAKDRAIELYAAAWFQVTPSTLDQPPILATAGYFPQ
jgi:hypothetical protein